MIISASRRTDILCYYSQWFMNRIKAGYVLVRNPMNYSQISKISLCPENISCIVFWTKDPHNIIPHLDHLDSLGYKYYFQFTLTSYNNTIEKNLRPKEEIEKTFIDLSKRIGRNRVVWRYDPIILNNDIDINYHKIHFRRLCEKLSPYTDTVIISFVDMYKKLKDSINQKLIRPITNEEIFELSQLIGEIAREYKIEARACCENIDLSEYNITTASCIDLQRIEDICGYKVNYKSDRNQRQGCGCIASIDIGAYNTCINGCIYCYAQHNLISTINNYSNHDPNSEILIGNVKEFEKIIDKTFKNK